MLLTIGALLIVSAYSAPLDLEQVARTNVCAEKQGLRCGAFVEAVAEEIRKKDTTLIPALCQRLENCTVEQKACAELTSEEISEVSIACVFHKIPELTSTAPTIVPGPQTTTETSSFTTEADTLPIIEITDPTTTTEETTITPSTTEEPTVSTTEYTTESTTTDAPTTPAPEPTTPDSISTTFESGPVTVTESATTDAPTSEPTTVVIDSTSTTSEPITFPTQFPSTEAPEQPTTDATTEVQTSTVPEEPATPFTFSPPFLTTQEPMVAIFSPQCQQSLLQSSQSEQELVNVISFSFRYYLSQDGPRDIKCLLLDPTITIKYPLDMVRRVCGDREAEFVEIMVNYMRASLQCEELVIDPEVFPL